MATITEATGAFNEAALDTPLGAACVKARGFRLETDWDKKYTHGIIVAPTITQDMLKGHPEGRMQNLLDAMNCKNVMVRGHGWGIDGDKFVWVGTLQEFRDRWQVD
jgi:hypothetical protein